MVPRIAVVFLVFVTSPMLATGQGTPGAPTESPGPAETSDNQKLELAQAKKTAATEEKKPELVRAALDLVQDVLKRDPINTQANILAGEIFLESNEFDSARDHFKMVLDIEPSNFRANLGYGKILNANRSYRQATAYLEKAERVAGDVKRTVDAKQALAIAYAGMGNVSKAIEKMDEVVRANPNDLDGLQTSVQIRLAAAGREAKYLEGPGGALAAAENYRKRAAEDVQQKPWDKDRLNRLSQAYDLELSAFRELHNSFYEHDARGQPTDKLLPGKSVDAAAALNRVAEKLSEHALLKLTLAQHDALMLAEKAVEYDPRNIKYLESLAGLYQRVQNRDRAVETCRKILELDPNHAQAKEYLQSLGETVTTQPAPAEEGASHR